MLAALQESRMTIDALAALWTGQGLDPAALSRLVMTGEDPALPSSFAIGSLAASSIGAVALAAAEIHRARGGPAQDIAIDRHDAAIEFRSERYLRLGDGPASELWDAIAGLYRCGEGWVRLHTNFPHHRDGILRLLDVPHDKAAVAAALARRDPLQFEQEAAEAGLVVAALRDTASWDASPAGQALAAEPLVAVTRIGDAPPRPLPLGPRPLSGLRALELTRIIAGPVAGRLLTAHGAEVLHLSAPHLPQVQPLVVDSGRGKRSASLDLREPGDLDRFHDLAAGADIVLQSYRPGTLERRGLGAGDMARRHPGIIHASLSAYGFEGPWAPRRGFDSLVQTATGINLAEAAAAGSDTPRPLPAQALDHAGGSLLAFGILVAALRRMTEGGSWRVRVSLARTGLWLRSLPRLPDGFDRPDPGYDDVQDRMEDVDSPYGRLRLTRHAARLAATPAHWATPPVPLGSHPAAWS
ncbi:carnitine dehydratase [Pseudoroseomonas deserti]|uniref:Carnitine dehydratase n=2 Tax=Teichococcus deserti TaxID=1817963 RepID=A0A1V2GWK5_9PROT|nr:carnitine dehydratase [Pseudoroseomonas deserti]